MRTSVYGLEKIEETSSIRMGETSVSNPGGQPGNIHAMVVGTSEIVAGRVKAALRATKGVDLAAEAVDGVEAVSKLRRHAIDVIFMDIGDPAVTMATALSRLRKVDEHVQVVLVATLTFANVKNAMAGLVSGAAEFIQAPSTHTPQISEKGFVSQIAELAQGLGRARREKGARVMPVPAASPSSPRWRWHRLASCEPSSARTFTLQSGGASTSATTTCFSPPIRRL